MPEFKQIVICFVNGRSVKLPEGSVRFAHLGQRIDEEYSPDVSNGQAVVNWDNVCFVREWTEPEEIDP